MLILFRRQRLLPLSVVALSFAATLVLAQVPASRHEEGLREKPLPGVVLTNAHVVTSPGKEIPSATIVIRDGVILQIGEQQVGEEADVPSDLRVVDLEGRRVYPGFIDAYSEVGVDAEQARTGAPYWNSQIHPELDVAEHYKDKASEELNARYRSQGITTRLIAPNQGIIKGRSAVVLTGDQRNERAILRRSVSQHLRLTIGRGRGRDQYPNSPMGAVALARQAFYDADWYRKALAASRSQPDLPRPEQNDALEELQHYRGSDRLIVVDISNERFFLRADRFAREFNLRLAIRGAGNEYRRLESIRKTGRPVIVPVDFPKPPNVGSMEAALNVSLAELMHWDIAPENPARLIDAGITVALTAHGLSNPNQLLAQVRKAIQRGLNEEEALRALTLTPAQLLGIEGRVGSLEPGKLANLIVTDGPIFDKKTKVLETWIEGQPHEVSAPYDGLDLQGKWELAASSKDAPQLVMSLTTSSDGQVKAGTIRTATPPKATPKKKSKKQDKKEHASKKQDKKKKQDKDKKEEAEKKKPSPKKEGKKNRNKTQRGDKQDADEPEEGADKDSSPTPEDGVKLAHLGLRDARFSAAFRSDAWGYEGIARLTLVITADEDGNLHGTGHIVWPDGTRHAYAAQRTSAKEDPGEASQEASEEPQDAGGEQASLEQSDQESEPGSADSESEESADQAATFAVNYPFGAFGRSELPQQPEAVLFRNATVWTCGERGVLQNASVLVRKGKIAAVGTDVEAPEDATVIDLKGQHLTPGIIDCHSHMATDGGINESAQAVTAEVRIGDFIDSDDIAIYRQLAGGVTAANILHGSANPIGGQNQVIKLRWGQLSEAMKLDRAPAGIKFALGENVKQSNWGDRYTTRYPQTRMGVEQIIRDQFQAAQEYQNNWDAWNEKRQGLPPRRDLQLEAIVEILAGTRWIHCHSYRQDEILALIRTLDDFNIRIGTFQHILEGYKVAHEMARHGAMGSSFSDWWAYKFEVYDAIPYNGALMHRAGVVVSFNSDDRELARHLNQEAAKAVKYGGVPAEEALKFVTLNPARQLRIDQYVGSIEVGKDADLVAWSGPPLSNFAVCQQTWIDGRRYFDREEDARLRETMNEMRNTLVQKILQSGQDMQKPGEGKVDPASLWPREDLFCHAHGHGHGHQNEHHEHEE